MTLMGGAGGVRAQARRAVRPAVGHRGRRTRRPTSRGSIGQYAHGNEPSHHIAYLYAYAGAPWKTAARVNQIATTLYGTGPEGLCGNEDCGQLSAWYLFSAMGFYPVNPAEGAYVHRRAAASTRPAIDLGGERTFVVEAEGLSPANRYVTGATLNGKPLDRCWISHAEIAAGGTLRFTMGAEPNRAWASLARGRPAVDDAVNGTPFDSPGPVRLAQGRRDSGWPTRMSSNPAGTLASGKRRLGRRRLDDPRRHGHPRAHREHGDRRRPGARPPRARPPASR